MSKTLMYPSNSAKNKCHVTDWSPIDEHMEELKGKRAVKTLIFLDIHEPVSSNEINKLYTICDLWANKILEMYPSPLLDIPDETTSSNFLNSVSSLMDKEFVFECRELILTGLSLSFAEKEGLFKPSSVQINKGPGPFNITAPQLSAILTRLEGTQNQPILSVQIPENFKQFMEQIQVDFENGESGGDFNYNVIVFQAKFGPALTFEATRNNGLDRLVLKGATDADVQAICGQGAPKSLGYPLYLLQRIL
ncbi:hypothetical protein Ddc_12407 [Ditylenchus destructor]|nr:hypothetical protein Ddc_12407 [Ditylenchus destructor]